MGSKTRPDRSFGLTTQAAPENTTLNTTTMQIDLTAEPSSRVREALSNAPASQQTVNRPSMFKNPSAFATEVKQGPAAPGADAAMRDENQEMQIDTTERAQKELTTRR